MLERARWAAEDFQRYDRHRTYAIAEAVARKRRTQKRRHTLSGRYGKLVSELRSTRSSRTNSRACRFLNITATGISSDPTRRCGETHCRNSRDRPGVIFALDSLNKSDLDAQFQNHERAADPKCDRHVAASCSPRMLRRCYAASRGGRREGRCTRRRRADRGAPEYPVDRNVHAVGEDGSYSSDRRNGYGPLGLFVVQSSDRRRSRKRSGICRQYCGLRIGGPTHHGQQIIRQFVVVY